MSACKDLREFIKRLEEKGELVRIKREVDARNFELASYIRHMEDGPNKAILFEKVKGYSMPVVANLYGSFRRCAIGCGIEEPTLEEIERHRRNPRGGPGSLGGISIDAFSMSDEQRVLWILLKQKIANLEQKASRGELPTQTVSDGPCQEVVITKEIDIWETLPVPWGCKEDGGPYINPAGAVMKDPESGVFNIGGYRHMVHPKKYGKDKIGAQILNINDAYRIMEKLKKRGEKYADIALCVGPNPAVNLMAWYHPPNLFSLTSPWSELNIASGFLGEPLKLVKCKTVDLKVPVDTQVVIEGKIPLNEKMLEGPMAEYTDTSACHQEETFIQVTAITHRRDAIFHALLSGRSREHATGSFFTTLGLEEDFLTRIRQAYPTVKDVAFFAGSHCAHMVVSVKQNHQGQDRELLNFMMETDTLGTLFKYVTIVDDDIDPYNSEQVEWARAQRAGKPDDFLLFHKARGYDYDPLKDEEGTVTRLGILATLPFGEKFQRPGPPQEMLERTRKAFEKELAGGTG